MIPTVAKFTKEQPCNKLTLWNCFRRRRGFIPVPVGEAKAIIGANAPRVMEANGYLVKTSTLGVDYFELTETGKIWLINGFRGFLKRHPARKSEARFVPDLWKE